MTTHADRRAKIRRRNHRADNWTGIALLLLLAGAIAWTAERVYQLVKVWP